MPTNLWKMSLAWSSLRRCAHHLEWQPGGSSWLIVQTNVSQSTSFRAFRIGFDRHCYLVPATFSLKVDNPQIVTEYLSREVALGRMWKVHVNKWQSGLHTSPLGIIPKKNKPGKWRLIVDLSSPSEGSVNGGMGGGRISTELSSLSYTSVDHLAALIVSAGRGSYMVRTNIKEAYRMVSVHPRWPTPPRHALGQFLICGLPSAPKIFWAVVDALQWILHKQGIHLGLHYLDDFILVASEHEAAVSLISIFSRLRVPLEGSKLEGPSSCLTFLGIEVDTGALQLRLPREKLTKLKCQLTRTICHKSVPKQDLESLTGLLQFATKVVRPGRPTLHALQAVGSQPDHLVRLSLSAQADVLWWFIFMKQWNGISLLWDLGLQKPSIIVH